MLSISRQEKVKSQLNNSLSLTHVLINVIVVIVSCYAQKPKSWNVEPKSNTPQKEILNINPHLVEISVSYKFPMSHERWFDYACTYYEELLVLNMLWYLHYNQLSQLVHVIIQDFPML